MIPPFKLEEYLSQYEFKAPYLLSGVLLMPASIYDVAENYFRIGFGRKNMPEALQRLKSF